MRPLSGCTRRTRRPVSSPRLEVNSAGHPGLGPLPHRHPRPTRVDPGVVPDCRLLLLLPEVGIPLAVEVAVRVLLAGGISIEANPLVAALVCHRSPLRSGRTPVGRLGPRRYTPSLTRSRTWHDT